MKQTPSRLVSSVAKNSLISGAGSVFNYLMAPISAILTTRALGAELFGVFALVQTWGAMLSNFSSFGLNGANLRLIPQYNAVGNKPAVKGSIFWTLRVSLVVSLGLTIYLAILPEHFSSVLVRKPERITASVLESTLPGAFRFYAVSILLTSVYMVGLSSLNGLKLIQYKTLANEFVGPVIKVVSLVALLALGLDLKAALLSNILQDLAVLVVAGYFLVRWWPALLDRSIRPVFHYRMMNKFGATLFVSSLLNKYTFQLDLLFLGYFSTLKEVGVYTVALRLQPLIYLSLYMISNIFSPLIGELHAQGKLDEMASLYRTVTKWAFTISLLMVSIILVFDREILLIFGKDFTDGKLPLLILSLGNLVQVLLGSAGSIIVMTGKIYLNLLNSLVIAVANVVGYYFLISSMGALGAALANSISVILISVLFFLEVLYYYKMHPFQVSLWKPVVAAVLSAAVSWSLKSMIVLDGLPYAFVLWILLGTGVFFAALYMFKLDEEDKFVLTKIRTRLSRSKQNT